jgi:hypothetical protein
VAVIRAAAESEDITALKTDPTNSYLFTVGLYKLTAVDPLLESACFNP